MAVVDSSLEEAETVAGGPGPGRLGPVAPATGRPDRVGPYRVVGLLGSGGMGRVYRAVDPHSGRQVAVKKVHRELAREERAMARFRREADAVEGLSHPNLRSLLGVGPDYIVLELVEGEDLAARLEREGVLPPVEARAVLGQTAAALDYIHARGVVHRDLKPSNVLLLPDGTVKLSDFGMAHLSWAPITRSGELIGSPAYMAPEQVTLGEVEPASDVHALGVVAFECLTGERPFKGDGLGILLKNVVDQVPPPAAVLNRSLPAAVDAVLERALAKDPDERFASATDFVAALAAALEQRADGTGDPDLLRTLSLAID